MVLNDIEKERLFKEYHSKVQGYIYTQVNNVTLAEDLTSDVFVKVYEKIDTFDDSKAKISTWIYTIARNRLIDYYRTRRVAEEIPEEMRDGSDVEEEVCNNQVLETLANTLEKLDEKERDILILHYYEGYKLKEVADIVGISYSYVKMLHGKALVEMKELLGDI